MAQYAPPNKRNLMHNNSAAIKFSNMPPPPTYAESLLYHKGFQFQPRRGNEKLNIGKIAQANIIKIVKEVDIELLQSFLENITFAEVSEDDFNLYSNDCFVKLFQLSQLTLEYLLDVQDTLSANLNGLAKKYAGKKRELDTLAKNLARQDAEVAMLRDEIHYNKEVTRSYESRRFTDPPSSHAAMKIAMEGEVTAMDPSLYPSQERRQVPVPGQGANSYDDESSKSSKLSATQDTIRLHIVSSIHGKYATVDVMDSLTIRALKEKLVCIFEVPHGGNEKFDSWTILLKGSVLNDPSQTLKNCQIKNDSALVLMHAQEKAIEENLDASANSPSADKSSELQSIGSAIGLKLEELTIIATKAQNELVSTTRMLQDQVSMQQANKDEFVQEIGRQLHVLENALHEEVQRRVHDAVLKHSQQSFNPRQLYSNSRVPGVSVPLVSNATSLSAKINIGEVENDRSGAEAKLSMGRLGNDDGGEEEEDEELESLENSHESSFPRQTDSNSMAPCVSVPMPSNATSLLAKLNIDELKSDDNGQENELESLESLGSLGTESEVQARDDIDGNKELAEAERKESKRDVGLTIETTADFYTPFPGKELSPFVPPKEIEISRDATVHGDGDKPVHHSQDRNDADDNNVGSDEASPFKLPENYSVHSKSGSNESPKQFSFDVNTGTPTPEKGYLDRGENLDLICNEEPAKVGASEIKLALTPSKLSLRANQSPPQYFEKTHCEEKEFRFSEFEYSDNENENEDSAAHIAATGMVYNCDGDDNRPNGGIPNTTVSITPGRPMTADSMHSINIEVSHSEHLSKVRSDDKDECEDTVGKKKSRLPWKSKSKKRVSMTKMTLPKWKSKGKKSQKLYEM